VRRIPQVPHLGVNDDCCRENLYPLSADDELLNEEVFDNLNDACRKLVLWRYRYNNVRSHSSLGNQTPAKARWTLEQFEGSAPGALAQTDTEEYENQTRRLSL